MQIREKLKNHLGGLKRSLVGRVKNHLVQAALPKKLKQLNLGRSVNHAHIDAYRLGRGPIKVLFLAGMHGNEVGTVKQCCTVLNHLNRHKKEYASFSFFFIPCLNPDGYLQAKANPDYKNGGHIGRFNAHEVDLNRNLPTKSFRTHSLWSHGKKYSQKTVVYCGRKGGSEAETRALLRLLHEEKIHIVFSFHNIGGDLVCAKDALSESLAADFAALTGFRWMPHDEWRTLHQSGTLKEWCEENKVSLLEIEGSPAATRWGSDWHHQKKALLSALAKLQKPDYNAGI